MFSSALRRAHFHLRCNHRSRCCGGGSLQTKTANTNTEMSLFFSVRPLFTNSRFVDVRNTADSLRKRPVPLMQGAHFSSSEEGSTSDHIKPKLIVNVNENLPEIYMSPSALLEEITHNQIIHLDCKSIVVDKDGKDELLHTATYIDKRTNECFHSGKFGGFLNEIGQNNQWDIPSFSSEETHGDDGKVYYRNQGAAKEAAASRALDCLAFRLKYSNLSILTDMNVDDALEPVRYCTDLPYLFPVLDENTTFEMNHWPCLVSLLTADDKLGNAAVATNDVVYGSLYREKEMIGTLGKVFNCTSSINYDGVWFTSTFVDNEVSKEGFCSAILRVNPDLYHPCKIRLVDDQVYYKGDIRFALDSAAARAIDCYNFRDKKWNRETPARLCYENPYNAEEGPSQSTDYVTILGQRGELLKALNREIIPKSRSKKLEKFSSYALASPHILHLPKKFLVNALNRRNVRSWDITFVLHSVALEAKFYSATFTDPISKEMFRSGLGKKIQVERHPRASIGPPFHLAEARVVDGKVYYRTKKLAEHAAAARAIDCYIFREQRENPTMIGVDTEKLKLCHEDPYENESERDAQQVNYDALMAKRDSYVRKKHRVSKRPRHRKRKKFATIE